MADKKRERPALDAILEEVRSHSVILEDMRSQNRATIEAVQASHQALETRMDRFEQNAVSRFGTLEAAVQHLGEDTGSRFENLEATVERLDQGARSRFERLEAALQRLDEDSRSRDAALELAIRDLKVSVQQNSVDIGDLTRKVETLMRLEQ